ncbi:MAG: hypothetical protein RLZ55_116 [Actinomycetota bacterium]
MTAQPTRPKAQTLSLIPSKLHHHARVTRDSAATADFYERILGMDMCNCFIADNVPSTGDAFPYIHLFFRMADNSTIAFFECASLPPPPPSSHPAYDTFDHLALEASSLEELARWKAWLVSQGVDVLGPVDHRIAHSIYFHDPNGHRLEFAANIGDELTTQGAMAREILRRWVETKETARRAGQDPEQALVDLIREVQPAR